MDNKFIIADKPFMELAEKLAKNISAGIISYQAHENDLGFHNWLTNEFKEKKIDCIIIPLSLPYDKSNTEGLLLGLHIRLNYELPIESRSIPIIFLSNLSIENIVKYSSFDLDNNPQNLLFTSGIYVSSTDPDEIKDCLEKAESVSKDKYKECLSRLNIHKKATDGHHDIANAWGCYKLAQVAGCADKILTNPKIATHLKKMFSKYLLSFNDSFQNQDFIDLKPLKSSGKKILFIDDKSDEGWKELMSNIFKGAEDGFCCIDASKYKTNDKFNDFEGFLNECRSHIGKYWDLIIIDIRLDPETEDIDSNYMEPTSFSGYKLVEEFFENNLGYRIMIMTASNKIWNVDAILKLGAKGYYIKESPDFNYPISETKKQFDCFKEKVSICFNDAYLQKIYSNFEVTKNKLPDNDLGNTIKKQLELSYYMISKAETKEQYAFAFISLYQIIELINKAFVKRGDDNIWYVQDEKILNWEWNKENNEYNGKNDDVISYDLPEWKKFAGIYFQYWKQTDNSFVNNIYHFIDKRNGFIHNDLSILNYQNKRGDYINRDIYSKEGFIALSEIICKICSFL